MQRQFGNLLLMTLSILTGGCHSLPHLASLANLEKSIVYQPTAYPESLAGKPLPFEEVRFQSQDGTELHGWFVDHPSPRAVALFCHGNAGNIASRGDSLMMLNKRHGIAVMTFDYRGYGKSQGRPNEAGIIADARAARDWLAKRKNILPQQVILMGRSLGGAVAIDLAATDGAAGLVVASTFTSLPAAARAKFPLLPMRWLMTQRFDSINKLPDFNGPVLISHGDRDQLIPYQHGRKLFAAANEPKTFITVENGTHNSAQSERYRRAFDRFLDQVQRFAVEKSLSGDSMLARDHK